MFSRISAFSSFAALLLMAGNAVSPIHAQLTAAQKQHLAHYAKSIDKLPAAQRKLLSSGSQNLYQLAKVLEGNPGNGGEPAGSEALSREHVPLSVQEALSAPLAAGVARVSDPSRDFQLSLLAGFTQSETSTASLHIGADVLLLLTAVE